MRVSKPEPFDKYKQYKVGERFTYKGKTLICAKYKRTPRWLIEKMADVYTSFGMFPTQCGMCRVDYKDCQGVCDSPCQKFTRTDRIEVNYKLLRFNKNERK